MPCYLYKPRQTHPRSVLEGSLPDYVEPDSCCRLSNSYDSAKLKVCNYLRRTLATAFASIYWASPFYNFDFAVHAGRYLAKDVGATVEARRTFSNGWMIGLWATITDVPFDDFGEGSFDKGMFFKIPLHTLLNKNVRSSYSTRIRPVQRDGGARLEDFSGNIWWDLRGVRYDALQEDAYRLSR